MKRNVTEEQARREINRLLSAHPVLLQEIIAAVPNLDRRKERYMAVRIISDKLGKLSRSVRTVQA